MVTTENSITEPEYSARGAGATGSGPGGAGTSLVGSWFPW